MHFKKVGPYRSVRVGIAYRALGVEHEDTVVWFWIGNHDEYERLIDGQVSAVAGRGLKAGQSHVNSSVFPSESTII